MKVLIFCLLFSISNAWALKNGVYFKAEEFPAVVAIYQNSYKSCTATKIAPKTYLTAAHCIALLDLSDFMQGSISIKQSLNAFRGKVSEIYLHPSVELNDFTGSDSPRLRISSIFSHIFSREIIDVGILKLEEEIPEIGTMSFYENEIQSGMSVTLTAYGDTGNGYPLYPRTAPQKIKKSGDVFISIKPSRKYPAEVMPGDSGSALIVFENGEKKIAGVAAWKRPGFLGSTGYFVHPDHFRSWVYDVLDNLVEPNLFVPVNDHK